MEIPNCALYARKFVDVLNVLYGWWAGGAGGRRCEVSEHFFAVGGTTQAELRDS